MSRHIAVDDAGTLINPLLAEGQVHGGIAQGVAQALLEHIHYDPDGQPKTTNFADYLVVSAAELPSFEVSHMETPTWMNPLGAKGVGESGTIGAIPSVYNAVIDAVSAGACAIWKRRSRPSASGAPSMEQDEGSAIRSPVHISVHVGVDCQTGEVRMSGPHINHLVLNVRDIEASHRFYTEMLGFEQCGELTHTMTMRFYRGARTRTTTSRSCRSRTPSLGPVPDWSMAPPGSASTTSRSATPTASRGWSGSATSRRTASSSRCAATTA